MCAAAEKPSYTRCKLIVKASDANNKNAEPAIHVNLTCNKNSTSEGVVLIDESSRLWDIDPAKFVAEGTPLTFFDDLSEFRAIARISGYLEVEPFELYDSEFYNLPDRAEGIPFAAPLTIQSSRVKLTNCSFVGNSAGKSGAIDLAAAGSDVDREGEKLGPLLAVDRSLFDSGRGYAGAIAAGAFPEITITNSSFIANEGYAIRKTVSGGSITIQGCIFDGNVSFAHGERGVLRGVGGGKVAIIGSTFENHWSRWGSVLFWKTHGAETPHISIEKSSFHRNAAIYGGVLASVGNAIVKVQGCLFDNNYAYKAGGAMSFKPATSGNFNLTVARSVFESNGASLFGGVISVYVRQEWFSGEGMPKQVDLNDNDFVGNSADGEGGVVSLNGVGWLSLAVSGGSFVNNSAKTSGGALALWGLKSVIVEAATLVGNEVVGTSRPTGGAIHGVDVMTMIVERASFGHNVAGSRDLVWGFGKALGGRFYGGGAIAMESSSSSKFRRSGQRLVIMESKFDGNSAAIEGGAIFVSSYPHGDVVLEGLYIHGSSARGGGAISIKNAKSVSISISKLKENKATCWEGGAAFAFHVKNLNITNTVFEGNAAPGQYGDGGAVGIKYLEISMSAFHNNTANGSSGGAVDAQYMAKVEMNSCDFDSNDAVHYGGSVRLLDVEEASLQFSNFNRSFSGASGGGVALMNLKFGRVEECGFFHNQAVHEGSAIFASGYQLELAGVRAIEQKGGVSSLATEDMRTKIVDSTFSTLKPQEM
ncbi:hypothetical protein BSKO_13496 [Bryopsis sp. KO-2023]|nr:hypothetical protein BSKO_13496 [Bryopsis sp. KO-2023]